MVASQWRMSDELWEKIAPLIPEHKTNHPLSSYRKRFENGVLMECL
ncbi:hypothetical protein ESOG_02724 [Escherichia coli E101]|mgnify:FL=1|jgi:transposase|nr:hypothetical protein ESOG_02724 [Escherichia coli E101]GCV53866.1 hypothetical protein HmCmsJML046_01255 [Escherichia coli]GDJ43117.1 hypothetical protein BvCmsKSNP120_01676 [Escherichia coli]SQO09368.1 Uncharacterised protein [Escherichia coli]